MVELEKTHLGFHVLAKRIVTAIGLRRRLGLTERASTDLPMNVVVRHDDGAVSFLVDEIGDVLEVEGLWCAAKPSTAKANLSCCPF
jgi:purine-binding chemotaxis protein CheW